MTPQLRCFLIVSAAARSMCDAAGTEDHFGMVHTPDILLHHIIDQIHLAGGAVRLIHGCIVHDSLQVALGCEDVVLEADVRCNPRPLASLFELADAVEAEGVAA